MILKDIKECEKEILDVLPWATFLKSQSEKQIRLFFKRISQFQTNRISSGTTKEQAEEIIQTVKGISFIEQKFLQIKNEEKGIDNEA